MRCYKVSVEVDTVLGEPTVINRYAGTQALAKATRDDLVANYSCKKSDVEIEEVEIPLSKTELLAFVNSLAKY